MSFLLHIVAIIIVIYHTNIYILSNIVSIRVVAEIDEVLGSRRYVTSEDLTKLTYLDQTLKEALRLHPPQPAINRITKEETKLGDYVIPAGTSIMCDAHVLHHNPKYWDDPDKFDPERFNAENKSKVNRLGNT